MSEPIKILPAIFFRTASGVEPVREWLRDLDKEDRILIGGDIKTVEFGWPIGMPTCRALSGRRGPAEVDLLAKLLLDAEPGVRRAAGVTLFQTFGDKVTYDPQAPAVEREESVRQLRALLARQQ